MEVSIEIETIFATDSKNTSFFLFPDGWFYLELETSLWERKKFEVIIPVIAEP